MSNPRHDTEFVKSEYPEQRGGATARITPAGVELVRRLAAGAHPDEAIAEALGIGKATFTRCKRDQEEVQEALDRGRAALEVELASLLLQKARGAGRESVIACIFLAKARCGWREGEPPADNRPNVTINLPDSRSPEEYLEMVRAKWAPEGAGAELPEPSPPVGYTPE